LSVGETAVHLLSSSFFELSGFFRVGAIRVEVAEPGGAVMS